MSLNRVAITGVGAVSPFGIGVPTFLENVWSGNGAVREMPEWTEISGLRSHLAAPVPDFDFNKLLPRSSRRTMGMMAVYAALATQEALNDSGLEGDLIVGQETGVAFGSTTGSPAAYEDFYLKYLPGREISEVKSGEFFKVMGHSCAANVCHALGITGEQWAPVSACTSSSQAVGLGYILIKAGRQRVMICGGAEEVHPSVTGVFDLLRAASHRNNDPKTSCRPFDKGRDGVVCGGGGGVLILEEYTSAMARGADIYAEIIGFGNVTDSGHIANPDKKSMVRAMVRALQEADLRPEAIDYVNAHATGTELGDVAEAAAIGAVVSPQTPVSSLKGHFGHTLGAAGALELIVVLEMMRRQEIIPTRNLEKIDPNCYMTNLVKEKTWATVSTVLKNNFALGGVNTSLILTKKTR